MINPQAQQQPTLGERANQIWSGITLVSRFLMISYLASYIISFFFGSFPIAVANIPKYTLYSFEIWRLVTASICTFSIFSLLIDLLIFVPHAITREKTLGTIRYSFYLLLDSVLVQLFYVLVMYLIHFKYSQAMLVPTYGLLPLFFADIVADCLERPEELRTVFISSAVIKAKYYPWILFFLFALLGGSIIPLLGGILVGYLHSKKWLDYCLNVSPERVRTMETNWLFSTLTPLTGFVGIADVNAPQAQQVSASSYVPAQAPPVPQPKAFSGKGVAVGTAKEEKRPTSILVQERDGTGANYDYLASMAEDEQNTSKATSERLKDTTEIELVEAKKEEKKGES